MITLVEVEMSETTCEECSTDIPYDDQMYFSDPHGGRESGYYCDDCQPRCFGPCCNEDYYRDI